MNPIDEATTALARLALDAASLRQAALAHNIANTRTPGFAPLRVNFEEQLGLARQALASGSRLSKDTLAGVAPFLETAPARATLALDQELVQMARNTLQYQALLRAIGRLGGIMSTAVNEGRR